MTTYSYATRDQIRDELRAAEGDNSGDQYVDEYRLEATRRIDEILGYKGVPETATRHIVLTDQLFDHYAGALILPTPMLSVTSVTDTDDTALTVWNGERATFSAAQVLPYPYGQTPIYKLERYESGSRSRWGSTPGIITIVGVWGFHRDYTNAWVDTGDTLQAEINETVEAITLSDPSGKDDQRYAPRLSAGNVIRVGSEVMIVTNTTDNSGKVQVLRGALGSTAASHSAAAAVSVWKADSNLERATRRLAAYMHKRRGQFNNLSIDALGGTTVEFPADIPDEVKNILALLPRYGRRAGVIAI